MIASCERQSAGPPRVLDVVLSERVSIGAHPVSYHLQIPENYFMDTPNKHEATSVEGATSLVLWTLYPDFAGHSSEHHKEFYNEISPNKTIRFSLAAVKPTYRDYATIRLNLELQKTANGEEKIRLIKDGKNTNELSEYEFVNQPGRSAYTWMGTNGLVYFECVYANICDAYKTLNKSLEVRYYFFRSEFSDFRQIDRGLDELINSFHPAQKN